MRTVALFPVAALAGILSACASTSVTPVGARDYPSLPSTQNVMVFSSVTDVKQPYEVVGLISHTDPGKYQILNLGDATHPA